MVTLLHTFELDALLARPRCPWSIENRIVSRSIATVYSPSPNASQLAARMKARRTLRSLGEGTLEGLRPSPPEVGYGRRRSENFAKITWSFAPRSFIFRPPIAAESNLLRGCIKFATPRAFSLPGGSSPSHEISLRLQHLLKPPGFFSRWHIPCHMNLGKSLTAYDPW
jgi:hypothetical protein